MGQNNFELLPIFTPLTMTLSPTSKSCLTVAAVAGRLGVPYFKLRIDDAGLLTEIHY